MNAEKTICPCRKVTKGDVLEAMRQGASRYRQVKEITGCGTRCGKCKDDIRKFIKKHRDG